jgi:glycosyltransferase involved in cell wall biosynthesis
MRIVIDMQGAQTESRFRGTGRYTVSFSQAVARHRGEHEIIIALNGLFPDTIEPIRAAFDGLLPQENIRVWYAPGPVRECLPGNDSRREAAECIREAFLASLSPDVIHICSLFEGYEDDAVTSIGRFDGDALVSVTLHDLIPLLDPDHYLKLNLLFAEYYQRKLEYFKRAALYLAISDASRQEGLVHLGLPAGRVVNTSEAMEAYFGPIRGDDTSAAEFSWDESAGRAMAAWESLRSERQTNPTRRSTGRKPRLAFVSPLPPERSGIADYSAQLLPALAEHYDIDVVAAQDRVDDPWINEHCAIRDIPWLLSHAGDVDRVLYHIGNSLSYQHMFKLLRMIPGVVALHDFFLPNIVAHRERARIEPNVWTEALYYSHGYGAVRERFRARDLESVVWKYPCNLDVLQRALGLIVHTSYSLDLARQWYGSIQEADWAVIPLMREIQSNVDRGKAREALGFTGDDFVVCSFGMLGPSKLNHRLLEAWLASRLSERNNSYLVFVGENHAGGYGQELLRRIKNSKARKRIRITGWACADTFRQFLAAADVAVQLRTMSRGETSPAVLDCMSHGLGAIVNANGSMAELAEEAVWMLPDEFDDAALIEALETLWREPERRHTLGARAREVIRTRHVPSAECARRYADAIERFHRRAETAAPGLIRAIAAQKAFAPNDTELQDLSKTLAATLPLPRRARCLFLDVSTTSLIDRKTGIERVARALTLALLDAAPRGYRVEPVYLSNEEGGWRYRYARRYTLGLLGCPADVLADEIVEPECGDVLVGLDISGDMLIQAEREGLYAYYRNRGVMVYFMVHDLLPITMPDVFPPGAGELYAEWLQAVSKFDGAICVSKAVADDFARWLKDSGREWSGRRPFCIAWSHHGADIENTAASRGLPYNAEWTLGQLQSRPSFLMVGMIEPRKGYLQVLEAFTELWRQGLEINLVIVGKEGWADLPDDMRRTISEIIRQLRSHSELGKRLFWLEGISDEYREKVYAASACLIAASYGEGFGLPLIEAARHKLPIIARDIPVSREVAGERAFYFKGNDPEALANAIEEWQALQHKNNHPKSDHMPWLTWKESAATLLKCLLGEDYRLNERCSSARRLWEDSQRDRPFAGAPSMRQNGSMLGDEAVNQLTEYEFEGPNRYYVAGENGNMKAAFKAPLKVFDDFVRSEHLESGRRAGEAVAKVKEVEQRASQAEARAQLAKILARQAEERAAQAEAKAELAEMKARQAEASAQQAEQQAARAEARASAPEIKARQAEGRAAEVEATLQAILNSHSWRVTKPLRWLVGIVRPKPEKANAIDLKSAGNRARTSPNWSGTSADSVMPLDLGVSGGQECVMLRPGMRGINADQRTPLESSFHFYSDKL